VRVESDLRCGRSGALPRAFAGEAALAPTARRELLEPWTPRELRALVHAGENDSDAVERALATLARLEGALDLAIGDGLAALAEGSRLISLGWSGVGDFAYEILDIKPRRAQAMAQRSRELRRRPLLRAAVMAGEVRIRHAETVLPVAIGDAEASWVERARGETVRALEAAVREATTGREDDEEWTRFRVRLSPEDREVVDEALAIAGRILPGSTRAQRLEAMAQEYLGEHPVEAGDDGGGGVGGSFRRIDAERRERREARLEAETERWAFLDRIAGATAPEIDYGALTALEIQAKLVELASMRAEWDGLYGWAACALRRSGLWRTAGFDSFAHYCAERLGLSKRTVEQRAALELRIWASAALRAARDAGVSYERLRLLSRLPEREIPGWIERARALTCVDLRAALDLRDEAQMRAAKVLRAGVPESTALVLQASFRAVRAVEGRLLDDGACLVRVARHFVDVDHAHARQTRRTRSQRIRERDLHRCQVPGCSRRAVHSHHVVPRSRGGSDDPTNLVALCAFHHLRGVHGGFMRVRGTAPDALSWEVRGDGGWIPFLPRAAAPPVVARAA
jgi:hypothetical protein